MSPTLTAALSIATRVSNFMRDIASTPKQLVHLVKSVFKVVTMSREQDRALDEALRPRGGRRRRYAIR